MFGLFTIHERVWNKIEWGKTKGVYIQMTGMSGAGKTTLAKAAEARLKARGIKVEVIDGDEYRDNLCRDLGFSREDRETNIKRLSFVGKVLGRNNVVCIMSAINPYSTTRQHVRRTTPQSKLVYVKCALDELQKRDTKGLYRRALLPDGDPQKVYNFTGISDPFDEPVSPDLTICTDKEHESVSISKLEKFILKEIGG
jgi:adenylylsulfate kinase